MPETDWDLIARCLSGEASPKEQAILRAWAREDPINAGLLAEMEELWEAVLTDEAPHDVHSAWTRFRQQSEKVSGRDAELTRRRSPALDDSTKPRSRVSRSARHPRPSGQDNLSAKKRRRGITYYAGVFALMAILIFAGILLYGNEAEPSRMATVETSAGEQAIVELPHGITVRLNAESRVTYEWQRPRSAPIGVTLQGEGFFDVPPKTTRTDGPALTVETSDVDVRVLGTRFNVRAYGSDEPLAVAIQKGSIDVQLRESKRSMLHASRRRVHLKEGEGARYEPGNDLEPFMLSSEDVYFGWTDRRLVLREASVAEVVRRLERWYGEDVELRSGKDANATLSATFHGESLTEALQVVNSVLGTDIVLAPSQSEVSPLE